MRMVGRGILLVMQGPLHGMVDFSGCELMRRLCRILLHFLFPLKIDGAIFGAMVDCTAMIHAVQRFECVRASAAASFVIQCSAYLSALWGSLLEGSLISFLLRCSKILLPIIWWPTTIRINVVH
jgi:hypothetical protein